MGDTGGYSIADCMNIRIMVLYNRGNVLHMMIYNGKFFSVKKLKTEWTHCVAFIISRVYLEICDSGLLGMSTVSIVNKFYFSFRPWHKKN